MGYCAICGSEHASNLSCFDGGGQAFKSGGMEGRHRVPNQDLKKTAKLADRWMMRFLLAILAVIAAIMIIYGLFEK